MVTCQEARSQVLPKASLQLLFYYYLVLYVPLWYADYFELKATAGSRETFVPP